MPIRVTVWGEYRHEKQNPQVAEIYPQGMHEAIATHLRKLLATWPSRRPTSTSRSTG